MTDVNQVPVSEEPVAVEPAQVTSEVKPGDKTEPNLLLKSLQEERELRRVEQEKRLELEAQLLALQSVPDPDVYSDEGKALQQEISTLKGQVQAITEEKVLGELIAKHPAIKDKLSEFNEFRKDYPSDKLASAAKLFLAENDLLEVPVRKGLEKSSGGGRTAPQQGMTEAEVKTLRETNFRKYSSLVKSGAIKV